MRYSCWKDWFGAKVGFSIYIHRRGFTSTTTNSHQPSQLPPKARRRASLGAVARPRALCPQAHAPYAPYARAHAPYARPRITRTPYARTLRDARMPRDSRMPRAHATRTQNTRATRFPTRALSLCLCLPARSASSHQHAGQAHHAGVLHPLVAGSISAPAGRCGVRGPKQSPVARAVASRHTQTTPRGSRSPRPRPRGSRGPGAGPLQPRVRRLIRGRVPSAKDATVGNTWC